MCARGLKFLSAGLTLIYYSEMCQGQKVINHPATGRYKLFDGQWDDWDDRKTDLLMIKADDDQQVKSFFKMC
jgi:hypothetical protein